MRDRFKIHDKDGIHFITSTITEWLPVFMNKSYFKIIVDSMRFCIENKKKYTANKIIEQLASDNKNWLLNQLAFYKRRHKKQSQYQVWQEGTHPELITNSKMLFQKIEYIHYNPVSRGYVDHPEHWCYSSARNYLCDDHSIIEVDCSLH